MKVIFVHHSCFVVEMEDVVLIFVILKETV